VDEMNLEMFERDMKEMRERNLKKLDNLNNRWHKQLVSKETYDEEFKAYKVKSETIEMAMRIYVNAKNA
jgi:hypothetical protein